MNATILKERYVKQEPTRRELLALLGATLLRPAMSVCAEPLQKKVSAPIQFALQPIPFRLETDETLNPPHAPATMAGGVAVFDYNQDGRPDIFFTNGANIATLKKDIPKYSNRLFRNDGNGLFIDVTDRAGLQGTGYDNGVAVGDYDNDGYPDLFVTGVHGRTLYHNNGDGTFSDVTVKSHLDCWNDPEYGPLWSVAAAWLDVNNDGWLDLLVVNYLRWDYDKEPRCGFASAYDYCSPDFYSGQPSQLFLNKGDGTFQDVSAEWGIRPHVGKGMGVGVADYDLDGRPDLFVTNDTYFNFLFHNMGQKFEEVALEMGVGLVENGEFVSGMGVDFRDINNDGFPDIVFPALQKQLFHEFRYDGGPGFEEVTDQSGLAVLSMPMSGYGVGLFDLDNDGWKDLFVSRGHVEMLNKPGMEIEQYNTVFRNMGASGQWQALTGEAGLTAAPPKRHRGCAFGDFDGDGRIDVVVTALLQPAEIWMNRSENGGHWLDVSLQGTKSNRDGIGAVIKVQTPGRVQWNHMTTSVGYASSSHGPVHFGLGSEGKVEQVRIQWPSGLVQTLHNVVADRVLRVKEASVP